MAKAKSMTKTATAKTVSRKKATAKPAKARKKAVEALDGDNHHEPGSTSLVIVESPAKAKTIAGYLGDGYVVESSMPAGNAGTQLPGSLRMGNVRVAAAFSGNSLIYRMDDVNYVSDPSQGFIADPASMLGNEMATWLDRSRTFKSVTQPGSTQSSQYVLEATVIELYGDFRPGKQPAAVVKVQFVLLNYSGTLPSVVYEGTIGQREPLERASPDILVRGYGTALSEILSQFVSELGARKIQLKAGR